MDVPSLSNNPKKQNPKNQKDVTHELCAHELHPEEPQDEWAARYIDLADEAIRKANLNKNKP